MHAPVKKIRDSSSEKDGYHFTSSNYFANRFEKMHALQRQGKLCDVMFTVGEEIYRAHKLVFASASQTFSDMFDENETDTKCELQIYEMSPVAFKFLLQFLYTGEIVITTAIVQDIIKASKKFKIDTLEEACQNSMSKLLNVTTCLQIKNIAVEEQDEKLYQDCHAYSLQHFDEIAETDTFLQLPFSEVMKIISDEDLLVTTEEKLYSVILKWVKQDTPNRAPNLSELLAYVKLPLIDKIFFTKNVVREPLMRENTECFNFVIEATDYHIGVECDEKSTRVNPRKQYRQLPYIFVAGGTHESTRGIVECEVYDIQTNKWHSISSMNSKRSGHALIGFKQLLYAFGGFDPYPMSSVEYYNPLKDSWTMAKCLPCTRWYTGVCSMDNSLYLCGGKTSGGAFINNVDMFDPATDVYVSTTPMTTKRSCPGLVGIDNCIYAVGGFFAEGEKLKSVEIFDIREGKWREAPSMTTPRGAHGVAVLDDYIYTSPVESSWERFNIRRNAWETIVDTKNEECPFSRRGCVYLLSTENITLQNHYDTQNNAVFNIPSTLKDRTWLGIALMDCLKMKLN